MLKWFAKWALDTLHKKIDSMSDQELKDAVAWVNRTIPGKDEKYVNYENATVLVSFVRALLDKLL